MKSLILGLFLIFSLQGCIFSLFTLSDPLSTVGVISGVADIAIDEIITECSGEDTGKEGCFDQ